MVNGSDKWYCSTGLHLRFITICHFLFVFSDKYPALLNEKDPHGFTLLHHAMKRGDDSKELYAFFQSKGFKDMRIKIR